MLQKSRLTAAAIVAGVLAAPVLHAQDTTQQQGQQVTQPGEQAQVVTVRPAPAQKPYFMTRQDIHEVAGDYRMEDGSHARITDKRKKLIVDFDDRVTELQPVGPNRFASSDNEMELRFQKDAFGDDMIVLSYIPARRIAGLGPVTMRGGG